MGTKHIVPRAEGQGGIGTATLGWGELFITNTTNDSATQGGKLTLTSNDGDAMQSGSRLGVIEFKGAESSSALTIGARIEAICDAVWSATENGASLKFYTTDANASESLVLTLDSNKLAVFSGAVAITGNLTVNGTTTTVNSTIVTIDDPVFTLGGDTAPVSETTQDKGIEFRYHTGSAAKIGFFGWDDSASAFTFIADATNNSEVFSGTAGNAIFTNITGTLQTAAQTNITSVGALNGGTITSGFGAINNGASAITTTGVISGGSLDIEGNADIDGTLEADAITVNGTALNTVIAGVTVTNATNSAHILVTDNESTNENNLITFVEGATSSTGNVGLEMDGNLIYNPSTGTVTATGFSGNLTGTLQTAAQGNITSLGTLTTLTVDNVVINGTTIGHTSNSSLMTLASGALTVAGNIKIPNDGTIGSAGTAGAIAIDSSGNTTFPQNIKAAGYASDSNGTRVMSLAFSSPNPNLVIADQSSGNISPSVNTRTILSIAGTDNFLELIRDVNGESNAQNGNVMLGATQSFNAIYSREEDDTDKEFRIITGTTTALTLDASQNATFAGKVGMNVAPASTRTLLVKGQGTSSSTAPFQVNDGNNADILVIKDDKSATFSGDFRFEGDLYPIKNNGFIYFGSNSTARIQHISSSNSLAINPNGGIVGIGSTGVFAGTNAILNLQGSGIALKNDKNGSNNNWSYIQNTGTGSNSDINFYTGNNASALNLSHSGAATFAGDLSINGGDLSFSADQDATISMGQRNDGGRNLDIGAGFAGSGGGTNSNGGNLTLRSGGSKGTGTSTMHFRTAIAANGYGATTEQMKIDAVGDVNITNNLFIGSGKAIYVGGTSSPNAFDDYEEGTWTPSYTTTSAATTVNYHTQSGYYTKVGNQVTCWFYVATNATTWNGVYVQLDGQPFSSAYVNMTHGVCSFAALFGDNHPRGIYSATATRNYLTYRDASDTRDIELQTSNMATGNNNNILLGTFSFQTS